MISHAPVLSQSAVATHQKEKAAADKIANTIAQGFANAAHVAPSEPAGTPTSTVAVPTWLHSRLPADPAQSPRALNQEPAPSASAGAWRFGTAKSPQANTIPAKNPFLHREPIRASATTVPPVPRGTQTAHAKHPLVLPHTIKDNRRTLSNGLIITERPSTGWPEHHTFDHNLKDMDHAQRNAWIDRPGPKLLACAWRQRYADNVKLASALNRLIPRLVDAPDLEISVPMRATNLEEQANRTTGPRHFLISGIRKSAEEALLYLNTLTTEGSVFFFIPFTTIKSAYIGTIEDLWLAKTMKSAHKVNEMVRVSILGNNHLLDFIRSRLPGDTTDAANTVVLTISVEAIEVKTNSTTTAVMWNVYCDPPPLTLADYQEWLRLVRSIEVSDFDAGRGHFHTERPFHCLGCHSMDHPTGLCPFPLIAGWLGPAPTSDLAEDTTVLGPTASGSRRPNGGDRGKARLSFRSTRGRKYHR
ncbi:hypothetical protein BJ912DRAFT_1056334 [Pholiota molesta]|nr:hypothetical protein BJ912DRAFT_1056334 [Pholiota molesta]